MEINVIDLFGVSGVRKIKSTVNEEAIELHGRVKEEKKRCPRCKSKDLIYRDKKERIFHLPPIGSHKANLRLTVRRKQCKNCNITWWPQLSFATGKQRMTHSFINHALDLLKFGTIKDVAKHLGVGWDVIKDIHKHYLQEKYATIHIEDVQYISIDEFAIQKGHKYMTAISDCFTGRVIHAIEGRKAEVLQPFLTELKKKQKALEE